MNRRNGWALGSRPRGSHPRSSIRRLGVIALVGTGLLGLTSCVADPPPVIGTAVAGDGQATVTWAAPPGNPLSVAAYVIQPYIGNDPQPTVTFSSTITTRTVTGLTNGAAYRFYVRAVSTLGYESAWSEPSNPVTPYPPPYHLALGDSLAFGTGAAAGQGYVPRITAAQAARVPGLTLRNVSCSGATTTSILMGGGCTYPEGNQVAAAEAFLLAHPGKVSFITINIGSNDVSGCVSAAGVDAACATARIPTVQTNLAQILTRLHAAAPGVPIVGMTVYNPFLAYWVFGNQAAATSSNTGAIAFNSALTSTYEAGNALVAPVATAFGTENTALTGTYNGVTVPQNVANICAWTRMCTDSDAHANSTGHQLIATTFQPVINAAVPAG